MQSAELKEIGEKCLAMYTIDKSNLIHQLHEEYQSGKSTIANTKYFELSYKDGFVYFNIEGHYAQAIFLKCSVDKVTWATIHIESDH